MKEGAKAVANAPNAKSPSPITCIGFQPKMSPTRPIGIINALNTSDSIITTQDTAFRVTSKSSAIAESATNTIVMLRTVVKSDNPTGKKDLHFFE